MRSETRTGAGEGGAAREAGEVRLKKVLERGEDGESKVLGRVQSGQGCRGWLSSTACPLHVLDHTQQPL